MRVVRTWMARAALGVSLLAATGRAEAQTPNISVWNFTGNCKDCAIAAGTSTFAVSGVLTLKDYIGGVLTDANFVTFSYSGSNLISAFTAGIGPQFGWNFGKSGNLTANTQTLFLTFGDVLNFTLDGQNWSLCDFRTSAAASKCNNLSSADFGTGSFVAAPPTTAVPEPSSYALMAAGLSAVALVRRRRRTKA